MRTIQVDRDVYEYIRARATQPGEPPDSILRRELRIPQPSDLIELDEDTYRYLLSKTAELGESASDILRRELGMGGPQHPEPPGLILFHVAHGTGHQAWNTREDSLLGYVGDTLRIFNDDDIPHRLHTNGTPFPHPNADILPGQSADFPLNSVFDSRANQPLYDHDAGPNATFWIDVRARQ